MHHGNRLKGFTSAQDLREVHGVDSLPAFTPPAKQPEAGEDAMLAEAACHPRLGTPTVRDY